MRKQLLVAAMVGLVVTATTIPTWAMVGVAQPEDPELYVITAVEGEPVIDAEAKPVEEVKEVQKANKIWYLTSPEEEVIVSGKEYTVVKGDTLWKIVKTMMKTKNPVEIARGVVEVSQMNHLANPDLILEGMTLQLPVHLIR